MKCKFSRRTTAWLFAALLFPATCFSSAYASPFLAVEGAGVLSVAAGIPCLGSACAVAGAKDSGVNFAWHIANIYVFRSNLDCGADCMAGSGYPAVGASQAEAGWPVGVDSAVFVPGWFPPEVESGALVPEPATLFLLASGLTALAMANRRLRR